MKKMVNYKYKNTQGIIDVSNSKVSKRMSLCYVLKKDHTTTTYKECIESLRDNVFMVAGDTLVEERKFLTEIGVGFDRTTLQYAISSMYSRVIGYSSSFDDEKLRLFFDKIFSSIKSNGIINFDEVKNIAKSYGIFASGGYSDINGLAIAHLCMNLIANRKMLSTYIIFGEDNDRIISDICSIEDIEVDGVKMIAEDLITIISEYDPFEELSTKMKVVVNDAVTGLVSDSFSDDLYKSLTGRYLDENKELEKQCLTLKKNINSLKLEKDIISETLKAESKKTTGLSAILIDKEKTIRQKDLIIQEKESESLQPEVDRLEMKNKQLLATIEAYKKTGIEKNEKIMEKSKENQALEAKVASFEYYKGKFEDLLEEYQKFDKYHMDFGKLNGLFSRYMVEIFILLDKKFFDADLTKVVYEEHLRNKMVGVSEIMIEVSDYSQNDIAHNDYIVKKIDNFKAQLTEDLGLLQEMKSVIETLPDKKKVKKGVDLKVLLAKMSNFAEERNKLN